MARLGDLRAAYADQQAALVGWLERLPPDAWDYPSRLAGWTVRELAFHATDMTAVVVRALADGPVREPPITIAAYTGQWAGAAQEIAGRDRSAASSLLAEQVLANAGSARAGLLDSLDGVNGDPVIAGRRGPLRLSDLMVTRINAVVHSLDLSASVPEADGVPIERTALAVACRMLTGVLAERVPGRTVEVRVPPFAAVQCVDGPRHTRGTPANVVEVEPVAWVELATGRLSWSQAVAARRLTASGERADLSPYLPVLA